MNDSSPIQLLPLADDTSAAADSSSGCGCGGCGCGESGATPSASTDSTAAAQDRPGQGGDVTGEHAYSVLGMTCGHCARAVTAELGALEADGLVECRDDGLVVTPIGRLLLRNLAMCFDPRAPLAPARRYSRTI